MRFPQDPLNRNLRNLHRYVISLRDSYTRFPYTISMHDFHMRFPRVPLNRNLRNLRRYMISIRDFQTRFPYTISIRFSYAISARSAESKFAKLAPALFGEANFRHVANELDRGGPRRKRIRQANREATWGAKFRGKQIYAMSQTN